MVFCISCSGKITREHFNVEYEEGFFRSYAYTEIKGQDGKPIPGSGKLTICTGISGFVSDMMRNAVSVGSAALIGAGIGDSGDNNTSNTRVNNSSNSGSSASSSSNANANADANSNAKSISGAASSPSIIINEARPHGKAPKD